MAIANPRQRNAESAIVHREQVIRQTSKGQRPLNERNAPEGKMYMEPSTKPPVPTGVDTGAGGVGKKTTSALLSTMGSTEAAQAKKGF